MTDALVVIGSSVGFLALCTWVIHGNPFWGLVVRSNPGYRFPPPKYPPGMGTYLDKHREFAELCKAYEADMVAMGSTPDPAEVARAVAEQLQLPHKYECDYHGYWTTSVYFAGHPSARYMQAGSVLRCSVEDRMPGRHQHWSEGVLGHVVWR